MSKQLLHTPEGVRDIYSNECEKKLFLQNTINKTIKEYGYEHIQTPTFEFLDIFDKEKGSVAPKNMYKFFDREGATLVLRPDITPAIARAVSKYYSDYDMPIRLSYCGNTFINNSEYQGKLKEFTQAGAELIGDGSSDADAEIIALSADCLLKCGLTEFQIEVGHVDFLSGILETVEMDEEVVEEFKTLLENKNYFGIEELVSNCNFDDRIGKLLIKLPEMTGQKEIIDEARKIVKNAKSQAALDRLQKVYEKLSYYGYEKYISFDLGMVSNYNYYTGIILRAYTYGTGDAIATGGRYDELLSQFGKNSPSMGFCIDVDKLLTAMNRQNIEFKSKEKKVVVIYSEEQCMNAIKYAADLRRWGSSVTLIKKNSNYTENDYTELAKNINANLEWRL